MCKVKVGTCNVEPIENHDPPPLFPSAALCCNVFQSTGLFHFDFLPGGGGGPAKKHFNQPARL